MDRDQPITFYDSVSGVPLFVAPKGRTFQEFVDESKSHGWPSFRDQEVRKENVKNVLFMFAFKGYMGQCAKLAGRRNCKFARKPFGTQSP